MSEYFSGSRKAVLSLLDCMSRLSAHKNLVVVGGIGRIACCMDAHASLAPLSVVRVQNGYTEWNDIDVVDLDPGVDLDPYGDQAGFIHYARGLQSILPPEGPQIDPTLSTYFRFDAREGYSLMHYASGNRLRIPLETLKTKTRKICGVPVQTFEYGTQTRLDRLVPDGYMTPEKHQQFAALARAAMLYPEESAYAEAYRGWDSFAQNPC
jgi:hypothetical protein